MKTASAYKALWDEDKQFLSAIAKEVATLAAVPNNMNHFQKQLTEFSDKWKAYKTAYGADRKRKWQPSMGKPKNPLGTIWPLIYGSGWRDGTEKCFPEEKGINLRRYYPCRDIKGVLGAYALLAVIHDNILPQCLPITKDVLPQKLSQEIWRNLVTGIDLEGQTFSGGNTVSQQPRSVIRRGKIAGFLTDVRADIGQDAPALSEIEKLYFNKFSPTHRKLWEAEKERQKQQVKNVQAGGTTVPTVPTVKIIVEIINKLNILKEKVTDLIKKKSFVPDDKVSAIVENLSISSKIQQKEETKDNIAKILKTMQQAEILKMQREGSWPEYIKQLMNEIIVSLFPYLDYLKEKGTSGKWEQASIEYFIKAGEPSKLDEVTQELEKIKHKMEVESQQSAPQTSAETGRETEVDEGYEVSWDEENKDYVFLKEAVNLANEDSITIRKMSRMLKDPLFPVHHMHNGRRCKVHLVEFRKWLEYAQHGKITDKAIEKYLNGAEKRKKAARKKKTKS